MQEAIIVTDDVTFLNRRLSEGWKVIKTCPMPSSVALAAGASGTYGRYEKSILPTCLVIIEVEYTKKEQL